MPNPGSSLISARLQVGGPNSYGLSLLVETVPLGEADGPPAGGLDNVQDQGVAQQGPWREQVPPPVPDLRFVLQEIPEETYGAVAVLGMLPQQITWPLQLVQNTIPILSPVGQVGQGGCFGGGGCLCVWEYLQNLLQCK